MQEEAVRDLRKQMTAAEVRAAWGKPAKIVLMDSAEGQAEVWTYEKSYVSGVREVQTSFTTYTRQNPITGQDETLSEPVYSLEQIVVDETIELLFFDSRLLEWKRSAETARKYQ